MASETQLSVCEIQFYFSIWWRRRDVSLACRRLHPSIILHEHGRAVRCGVVKRIPKAFAFLSPPSALSSSKLMAFKRCLFYSQIWAAFLCPRHWTEDLQSDGVKLSRTGRSFPTCRLRSESFPPVIFLLELFTAFLQNKLTHSERRRRIRTCTLSVPFSVYPQLQVKYSLCKPLYVLFGSEFLTLAQFYESFSNIHLNPKYIYIFIFFNPV